MFTGRSRALIIAAVVIIVLIAVVALYPQPSRQVNEDLLKQCTTRPPSPEPESQNTTQREQFGVWLATPGTASKLCAEYVSNSSSSVFLQLNPTSIPVNSTTNAIEVQADPNNMTVPGSTGNSPTGAA